MNSLPFNSYPRETSVVSDHFSSFSSKVIKNTNPEKDTLIIISENHEWKEDLEESLIHVILALQLSVRISPDQCGHLERKVGNGSLLCSSFCLSTSQVKMVK